MNNKRERNFLCIIYEDDENFDNQYFNLMQEDEVIYIRHDKDLTDDGEDKKPHYHFVIKLKNACTLSAFSKRVGVSENMIEPIKKSFNGSLKYLIHFKDDFKYNYDPEEVKSNSDKLLKRFKDLVYEELPGNEHAMTIQEFIMSQSDYVKMSSVGAFANSQGTIVWTYFMRYYNYIRDIVKEHNADISYKKYHTDIDYDNLY